MCKPIGPRCWECPAKQWCTFGPKNLKPSAGSKLKPNVTEKVQKIMDEALDSKKRRLVEYEEDV